ncbi:MAG: ABC transporter permease, partial [Candidatus Bathyarchaeota archaeon]|nr:ABC transporter permease [Candidatus Bathyarchaeota archaeon]
MRSSLIFYPLQTLYVNRELIISLTRREILGRYRGSLMGLLWSFFTPLLMLAIYTFVFSVV